MFKILLIGYFCKFTIARREYKYIFFSSSGFCKAYNKASCTVECTVTWKLKFDMCKLQKIFSRNFRHFTWKRLQHGADFSECLWKACSQSKISQNLLDLKLLSIKENKLKLKERKLNKNVSGKKPPFSTNLYQKVVYIMHFEIIQATAEIQSQMSQPA